MKRNPQALQNATARTLAPQAQTSYAQPCEFRVLRLRECAQWEGKVDSAILAARYWRANIPSAPWFDPDKECAIVIILDVRRHVIGHNLVALGCIDKVMVPAREVFRPVIVAGGKELIILHNHPGGDPTPSEADITMTESLEMAGQLLNLFLLDHLIMGCTGHVPRRDFVSMRELGFFHS